MSKTTATPPEATAEAAAAFLSGGGAGTWELDPAASSVRFRQKTIWGLVTVKGTFTDVRGEGRIDADGMVTGQLVVQATSVDTNNRKRDEHLRTADFFDVERYPEIVATIRKAALAEGVTVNIGGQIEVVGQPSPLTFSAGLTHLGDDAVRVAAETTFDRAAVGITWNRAGVLRGPTTVEVELHFTRAPA